MQTVGTLWSSGSIKISELDTKKQVGFTLSEGVVCPVEKSVIDTFPVLKAHFSHPMQEGLSRVMTCKDSDGKPVASRVVHVLAQTLEQLVAMQESSDKKQAHMTLLKNVKPGPTFHVGHFKMFHALAHRYGLDQHVNLLEDFLSDYLTSDRMLDFFEKRGKVSCISHETELISGEKILARWRRADWCSGAVMKRCDRLPRGVCFDEVDDTMVTVYSFGNTKEEFFIENGELLYGDEYFSPDSFTQEPHCAVSSAGRRMVSVNGDGHSITMWHYAENGWQKEQSVSLPPDTIRKVALTKQGDRLAVASANGTVYVFGWDGISWKDEAHLRHGDPLVCVAFNKTGDHLVTVSDGVVRVWSTPLVHMTDIRQALVYYLFKRRKKLGGSADSVLARPHICTIINDMSPEAHEYLVNTGLTATEDSTMLYDYIEVPDNRETQRYADQPCKRQRILAY